MHENKQSQNPLDSVFPITSGTDITQSLAKQHPRR